MSVVLKPSINLSRRVAKILDNFLEDPERISRGEAVQMLMGMGFMWRRSNGSHNKYQHPSCGATVTWGHRKNNETVWGYEAQDLRKAIYMVLECNEINMPQDFKKRGTPPFLELSTVALPPEPPEEEPVEGPTLKLLNYRSLPDEVCELLYEYKHGDLKGAELVKLLNESNYRTVTGMAFTPNNIAGTLGKAIGYDVWAANRKLKQEAGPIIAVPADLPPKPLKDMREMEVVSPRPITPVQGPSYNAAVSALETMMAEARATLEENERLKQDNARLRAIVASFKDVADRISKEVE